jgi:hypothetical protein
MRNISSDDPCPFRRRGQFNPRTCAATEGILPQVALRLTLPKLGLIFSERPC